jgi:hypothetical protein
MVAIILLLFYVPKALFFIVPYDRRFCKRLGGFFRKKKLGLCPKPHLRSFFEKKPLKNPQKAFHTENCRFRGMTVLTAFAAYVILNQERT